MCPIGTLNSVHVSNSEFYQLHTVKLVYSKFTTEILWLTLLLLQINKEFVADIDIKILLWVFHLLIYMYVLNFFLVKEDFCQTMYEVFQIVVAPKICYGWVLLLFVFLLWVYCRILWIPTLDLFNYLSVIRGLSCNTSFFFHSVRRSPTACRTSSWSRPVTGSSWRWPIPTSTSGLSRNWGQPSCSLTWSSNQGG